MTSATYSSVMDYLSPLESPSCTLSGSLPATPLRGLGLSECNFLPGTEHALRTPPHFVSCPNRHRWLGRQAIQNHSCVSTVQPVSETIPQSKTPSFDKPRPLSTGLVQTDLTTAVTYPTISSFLEYPCPQAPDPFSASPSRLASPLDYQIPFFITTSSSMAEPLFSWYDLEAQSGYPTPRPPRSYPTPLRMESPSMSHINLGRSAQDSRTSAVNLQFEATAVKYNGLEFVADSMQRQRRAKSYRALSWPCDGSYFEQSQEMDARINTQVSESHLARSRRSHTPHRGTRIARGREGRNHRTDGAKGRVTCSFSDGCKQTFNRKTDLDRHINTVRGTQHHFYTFTYIHQVHLRMRNKLCPFCGYGFGRGDILTR